MFDQIYKDGTQTTLGYHESQEDAAGARDRAYIHLHNDYTRLNFVIGEYDDVEALKGNTPKMFARVFASYCVVPVGGR